MPYNDISKRSSSKYRKREQKQISISFKITYYEEYILPCIKKSGIPVATFIKKAIEEKIERDKLR